MKGLVISWFYPPINSSEGLVTFKLLNRSDMRHDVFTQQDDSSWSYNSTETKLTNKNIRTIFGNGESLDAWVKSCVKYFDKHHNEYEFIMSRSMPPESHVAALAIKRKYPHIKWIASFGDPIFNSPYTNIAQYKEVKPWPVNPLKPAFTKHLLRSLINAYRTKPDRQNRAKNKKLESGILELADAVIFNNPYQQEFMLGQHQLKRQTRSIVIPHPFEDEFYGKRMKPSKNTDKISITHIGHLDLIRTPINFLKAVARLRDTNPELYKKLDVSFYGTFDEKSKVYLVDNELFDSVHIKKPVTYFESLDIMQKSDWCLLVDANISLESQQNIYFAAKLADYLGSNRPIFALTMYEGASADIIRHTNNILSSHSVDEIYMFLVLLVRGLLDTGTTKVDRQNYSAAHTSKLYDNLVKELVDNS